MKRTMLLLVFAIVLMVCATAHAEEISVYVSITDSKGELVMAHEKVSVTDADDDGNVTINDALIAAHEQKHPDGKAAFKSENTEYGLSLVKLWNEENGGSFGYYLNHASAWSLLDVIKDADHIKAYAFTDLEMWSDTYAYFSADCVSAKAGETVELTLNAAAYDANWNPVTLPVANAVIKIDGALTEMTTNAEGVATLVFENAGEYVISAASAEMTLVTPVCIVTVE